MERPDCVRAANLGATQTRGERSLVLSPHSDVSPLRSNVQINAKYRRFMVYDQRGRERERERPACFPLYFSRALQRVQQYRSGLGISLSVSAPATLASRVGCKISQNLAKSRTLHASTALVASFPIVQHHQCLAQKRPRRAQTHASNAHASCGEKIEREIHCVLLEISLLVGY